MICGIDEAGRGPVIGPMVIAGVQVKDEKVLDGFRIRDSKKCSPERREKLADTIKSKADKIHIVVFDADEIDELRKRFTINEIEVEGFCRVMRVLRSDRYYVDSADVDEKRFANELRRRLEIEGKKVCFIIGGWSGLEENIRKRADKIISLSKFTFPYQLARMILLEQIYRAFYHHSRDRLSQMMEFLSINNYVDFLTTPRAVLSFQTLYYR